MAQLRAKSASDTTVSETNKRLKWASAQVSRLCSSMGSNVCFRIARASAKSSYLKHTPSQWPDVSSNTNYDEPNAMKAYAIAQGVPESAIYCDGGGYHTYDTMWRVANVYGAQSVAIVTQKYHQYRAVFDAQGVGMSAVGVVSDTGTYDDQAYYDIREWPARVQDAISVWTGAEPDNPGEAITL